MSEWVAPSTLNSTPKSAFPTEQQLAFDKYIAGENIFITGPGGTGKTHVIKNIVEHAKANDKAYRVCALTGCAAVLLMCGAITLHAFAGIGLEKTKLKIISDSTIKTHIISIKAKGDFGEYSFVENVIPSIENEKTGKIVSLALIKTLNNLASNFVVGN